jgi:MOSC domain-containing protein YiiM
MYLQSINIGTKQTIQIGDKWVETGIFKTPVTGPVVITTEGAAGDVIHAKRVHGGPEQALYIYGALDYAWWADQLGHPLSPGTFGENLTISELESASFRLGDRLVIGEVVLEVSGPRLPCPNLAKRMADRTFVNQFRQARRPGFYCRVLQTGVICAGDRVILEAGLPQHVTVAETFAALMTSPPNRKLIQRVLAPPSRRTIGMPLKIDWEMIPLFQPSNVALMSGWQ